MSTSPNELNSTAVPEIISADQALTKFEPATGSNILSPEQLVQELAVPAASTSEIDQEEIDFDGELNQFKAQLPSIPPATAGEQNEQLCNHAKHAIMHYYGTSIIYEYLQGKNLFLLQQERAKPGTGTFVADLAELRKAGALGLSTATAYRRISNYEAVSEGLVDLLPLHLSQAEKDEWDVEEVTLQDIEEALERNAGDEFTTKYQAMIAEQKKLVAKLKREQGGSTTLNIQLFGLSKEQKDQFHAAFDSLVQAKGNDKVAASKYLVDMVCLVANTGKVVAA